MTEIATPPEVAYDKEFWQDKFSETLAKSGIRYGLNEVLARYDSWFGFATSVHTVANAKRGLASTENLKRIVSALELYIKDKTK